MISLAQLTWLCVCLTVAVSQTPRVEDPLCIAKGCPSDTTCRTVADTCSTPNNCTVRAECLVTVPQWSHVGVCQVGDPILVMTNGVLDDTRCGTNLPCPENAYCNTELQDTYSTCCRSDPTNPVKPGTCPPSTSTDIFFCVDQCNNDGDCRQDMKCCQDGCRRLCVPPQPVNPCLTKKCPSGSFCLSPDIPPCTGPGQCYNLGDCVQCPRRTCRPCRYGNIPDGLGCPTCTCLPPPVPRRYAYYGEGPNNGLLWWYLMNLF